MTPILQSKLINLLILNIQTAEPVGKLSEILINPATHNILGLIIKTGLLNQIKHIVLFSEIQSIGKDSIIVALPSEFRKEKPSEANPIIGHQLWSDKGNKIGTIIDYRFDLETGNIIDYLFTSSGWKGLTDSSYILPITSIITIGTQRVMAKDDMINQAEIHTQGVTQKITQVADFLKQDYNKTQERMTTIIKATKQLTSSESAPPEPSPLEIKATLESNENQPPST